MRIAVLNPSLNIPKDQHYSYKLPTNNNNVNTSTISPIHPELLSLTRPKLYDPIGIQDVKYSSSTKLGKKWKEYQGINNWEGLLDPLDDNLRSEILRYGQFVTTSYQAFDFDTSSPTYGTCKFPPQSLFYDVGLGYRLTDNLNATCGIQLPSWIPMDRAPTWMSKQRQSNWIGFMAVCEDEAEIARLGRRDVVIAYRGTGTCLEWVENLRATLAPLPDHMADEGDGGAMVESGFLSIYTSSTADCPSLQETVRSAIGGILKEYGNEPLSITITGHSLGAALAILTAYDINSTFPDGPMVTVISFAGPRVGNQKFRCQLEKSETRVLRIVNADDLITKMPGFVIDEDDVDDKVDNGANMANLPLWVQERVNMASFPAWVQEQVKNTQWVYADVGQELRLSSRDCPYFSRGNVVTCHELSTYLELVNGFVSSTCPFKASGIASNILV